MAEQGESPRAEASRPRRRVSLLWLAFVPNAIALTIAVVAVTLSPATLARPTALTEAAIIVGGLGVMLALNLVLVRWALKPLERLARAMATIDPLSPWRRIDVGARSAEVAGLTHVFNDMVQRLEAERKESALRMLASQEGERRRVARELHDEVSQSLTALMLEIGELADGSPPETAMRLRETRERMRALSSDVQRIVGRLRPEALDDLGLTSALTVLINGFAEQTGVEVARSLEHDLPPLSSETELVVYRVTQEALTNVARHSDARAARVELRTIPGKLSLEIADSGRGMNGAVAGSGIRGMRERALLIGGRLSIDSGGEGTAVRLEIPLEEER